MDKVFDLILDTYRNALHFSSNSDRYLGNKYKTTKALFLSFLKYWKESNNSLSLFYHEFDKNGDKEIIKQLYGDNECRYPYLSAETIIKVENLKNDKDQVEYYWVVLRPLIDPLDNNCSRTDYTLVFDFVPLSNDKLYGYAVDKDKEFLSISINISITEKEYLNVLNKTEIENSTITKYKQIHFINILSANKADIVFDKEDGYDLDPKEYYKVIGFDNTEMNLGLRNPDNDNSVYVIKLSDESLLKAERDVKVRNIIQNISLVTIRDLYDFKNKSHYFRPQVNAKGDKILSILNLYGVRNEFELLSITDNKVVFGTPEDYKDNNLPYLFDILLIPVILNSK